MAILTTTNQGLNFVGGTTFIQTGTSTVMSIQTDGNVGIGTVSPTGKLTVSDNGGTGLEIYPQDSSTRVVLSSYDRIDNAYRELNYDAYNHSWEIQDSPKMVLINNGNVGIGVTGPTSTLEIGGGFTSHATPSTIANSIRMGNNLTTGLQFANRFFNSISGTIASGVWIPIVTVADSGTFRCTLVTAAHSNVTFIASRGYNGSNRSHIQILDWTYNPNGSYANVSGLRIRVDGQVEMQMTYSSGPNVSVDVVVNGDGAAIVASLAETTGVGGSVLDTVLYQNEGMMRSYGTMQINDTPALGSAATRFLVPDTFTGATNMVKSRTAAQVLSDIGAAPATGGAYLPVANPTFTGVLTGPSADLEFIKLTAANPGILMKETDTTDKNWDIQLNSGNLKFYEVNDARSVFNERVTFEAGGNVGIGVTNPGRELDVLGVIQAQGPFFSIVSSTSTNLSTANGGQLSLYNSSNTDSNFNNIGGYNSNSLVTSQICFVNESQTNRTGAIAFMTHNGGSMPERLRIDSSGNSSFIGSVRVSNPTQSNYWLYNAAKTNAFLLGRSLASNDGQDFFIFDTVSNNARLVINSSGKVGIGTTTPQAQLEIAGSTEARYLQVDAIAGFAGLGSGLAGMVEFTNVGDGNNVVIKTNNSVRTDAAPFSVYTASISRFVIRNDGKVGIGTITPAAKLDVVGNIKSPTNSLSATAAPTSFGVYTSEVRLIDTPNGGLKKCRVITDVYGEWILVGRFAASAMNTIANAATWSSVSGMTTGTAQNETTQFSADFGDSFPEEVRIMGATDFTSWRDTRTVDFVYKVPEGRKWKYFFSGGVENGMVQSTKFGWNINGAYDGFGRWVNTAQNFVRMSDGQVNNPSAAYTTATTNAFAWDTADDAKITVSATRVFSGQDTFVTAGFGNDDNIYGFFDEYPNETSNMQGGVDFSSAAWVLIKLPEGASGSGGSGTNYWAANGNDISNTNSGSVGIGTDSPGSSGFAKLHVCNGTPATYTPNSEADTLVLESSTPGGISLIGTGAGGNAKQAIVFGTTAGPSSASIIYDGNNSKLVIGTTSASQVVKFNSGNSALALTLDASQDAIFNGKIGIGVTNPETKLHVVSTTTDNASTMLIQNTSTGDASIKFNISGDTYSIGIDNSDGDKFKLSYGAVGTTDRIVVDSSGNVGIGTSSPTTGRKLDVNGDVLIRENLYVGETGGSIGAYAVEVGQGRTGNGYAFLDLVGDATYTDFGLRVIRDNTGANAKSSIIHRGTGNFEITTANEGADIVLFPGGKTVNIGTTTGVAGVKLNVDGITLIKDSDGVSDLYLGNFSTAKFARFHTNNADTYFDMNCGNIIWRQGSGTIFTMNMTSGNSTQNGTSTATNFILSSDKRLKENIKTLEPKAISAEWKSFNVKDDDSYRTGVIAQELEVKHPEFVETNEEGFKSVKYIDLLISKIAELEHRIKQLEK